MKGLNIPYFFILKYLRPCNRCSWNSIPHVVSISGPEILGFRFRLNSTSTRLACAGTQQAPKKMTSMERSAAEIREGIWQTCPFKQCAFSISRHSSLTFITFSARQNTCFYLQPIHCTENLYPHPSHSVK